MNKSDRILNIIGIICLAAGAGVLVYTTRFIFSNGIWFDEVFTVQLAAKPMSELIAFASKDVHPPLYYILVRIVYLMLHRLGTGLTVAMAAKLTSLLPYYLIILYASTLIRRRFGWMAGGLTVLFTMLMPQMSAYMVEARMYSWAMFTVLAMFLHGMEAVRGVQTTYRVSDDISYADACSHIWCFWMKEKKKIPGTGRMYLHLIAAMCYAIAAMYLHYYAFIGAAAVALCMLVYIITGYYRDSRRIRCWKKEEDPEGNGEVMFAREHRICVRPDISSVVAVIVICLIAYVPWEGVLLSQVGAVSESYWIQPVTLRTLAGCIKYIFKPDFESGIVSVLTAVFLFAAAVAGLIWYIMSTIKRLHLSEKSLTAPAYEDAQSEVKWKMLYVLSCFAVPVILVLIGFAASLMIRPVFVYRYMLPVMGLMWMGTAVIFSEFVKAAVSYVNQHGRIMSITSWIAVSLTAVILVCTSVRDFNLFRWEENKKTSGMESAEEVLNTIRSEYHDRVLVCNFNQVQAVLWNYLDNESILWGETDETLIAAICGREPYLMTDDTEMLKSLTGQVSGCDDGFIFVGSGNAREDIIDDWQDQGMTVTEIADSCLIERYYFNIYRVDWND